MMRGAGFWIGAAAFIALAFAMALTIRNEYAFFAGFVVLQFIVLATAWNILGGYAGYVNFGTSAFFGVGVYTAVFLLKAVAAPLWIQIGVAALVGAALGLGVGLLTLRLRGIFFSIATVAITIIAETLITNWKFVGGATGVQLLRPPVTPLVEKVTFSPASTDDELTFRSRFGPKQTVSGGQAVTRIVFESKAMHPQPSST